MSPERHPYRYRVTYAHTAGQGSVELGFADPAVLVFGVFKLGDVLTGRRDLAVLGWERL